VKTNSNWLPGQLLILNPKLERGYNAYVCASHGIVNDFEKYIGVEPGQPIMFIRKLIGLNLNQYDKRAFSLVLVGEQYGVLPETYLQPFNQLPNEEM